MPAPMATATIVRATSTSIRVKPALVLGPEPIIGAQRIVLRLNNQRLVLATDGLAPFQVSSTEEPAAS
jgi:general secretion pathway protein H